MAKKSNKKKSNRQKQIKKRRQQAKQALAAVSAIKQNVSSVQGDTVKQNVPKQREKKSDIDADVKKKRRKNEKEKRSGSVSWGVLFFPLAFVYYEFVFHLFVFGTLEKAVLLPCLIGLVPGCIFAMLTSAFRRRLNLILSWILLSLTFFVYCGQRIYHYVFKFFMAPTAVAGNAVAITEFFGQVAQAIWDCSLAVLLFAVPFALLGVLLKKRVVAEKASWKAVLVTALTTVVIGAVLYVSLPLFGKEPMMPYELIHGKWVQEHGYRRLGVAASVTQDLIVSLTEEKPVTEGNLEYIPLPIVTKPPTATPEPTATMTPTPIITQGAEEEAGEEGQDVPVATATPTPSPSPTPTPIDTSPNIMQIDFSALVESEKDAAVKELHKYFAVAEGTRKNEYTGMFEGYNLISICAEAFSPDIISEELTPTLYRMFKEGFQFNNYYEGIWFSSTSDGEYLMNTGLYPQQYSSMAKTQDNLMYFCLGNQFARLGYECYAYHNHSYDYYDRHLSHPNMGYDYKGEGGGLQYQNTWPESDLLMVQETLPEYINAERFHAYYMTVSGHKDYLFGSNVMSRKNKEYVEQLEYSEPVKAYIACNLELEFALTYLVEELEKAGRLDDTVFVLTADHYPYGLTDAEVAELRGEAFASEFDLYREGFLIWNSKMAQPVVIDKPCSNVDVLPTVSNLFGLEYDSRLLMGNDILSDYPGYVLFNNWSLITELCEYSTRTGKTAVYEGVELPDGYVSTMHSILGTKFNLAKKILDLDYYAKIPELRKNK